MKEKLKFCNDKLKGRMREKKYTQANGAHDLNIAKSTFNLKLNSNSYFTQNEIFTLAKKLEIKVNEIPEYFFMLEV